jgi:hypothetical protein
MTERQVDVRNLAVLQVDVDGYWTANDLAVFVHRLDRCYDTLNALEIASDHDLPASRATNMADLAGWASLGPGSSLRLLATEFGSPGFWAFLGGLNPLKTLADFITAWRHENTIRDEHVDSVLLEKERLALQREDQVVRHRLELFDRVSRVSSPELQAELARQLVVEVVPFIADTARDMRVGNVSVPQLTA